MVRALKEVEKAEESLLSASRTLVVSVAVVELIDMASPSRALTTFAISATMS